MFLLRISKGPLTVALSKVEHRQVYGNAKNTQIIDPQDAANHISTQVIEDKNLPDRISVGVQNGRCLGCQPIRLLMAIDGGIRWRVVEIEYLGQGCCPKQSDPISCSKSNSGRSYLLAGLEVFADEAPFAKAQIGRNRCISILGMSLARR